MKRIALFVCLGIISMIAGAQPGNFKPEFINDDEMIQMQIRDMVCWLNLDDKTKDTFIKEYTAFKKEIGGVFKNATPPKFNGDEAEIDKALQNNFEVSEKILDIRKKYYVRFKTFMKPSQIMLMYRIENEAGRRMHDRPGSPEGNFRHGSVPPPPPSHHGEPGPGEPRPCEPRPEGRF